MQAAHFGNRDDRAKGRRLDRPFVGCILVEREVGASPVIVLKVRGQETSEMSLAEHDDMVEALASERADEALYRAKREGRNRIIAAPGQ